MVAKRERGTVDKMGRVVAKRTTRSGKTKWGRWCRLAAKQSREASIATVTGVIIMVGETNGVAVATLIEPRQP